MISGQMLAVDGGLLTGFGEDLRDPGTLGPHRVVSHGWFMQ